MATLEDFRDTDNRFRVSTKPSAFEAVASAANTVNAAVVADVTLASNVTLHVKNTGTATIAAGTFVFEASVDSTNGANGTWFAVQFVQTNANTVVTSAALSGIAAAAGNAFAWEGSVNAYNWIRVRCTVAVTASASAWWTIIRGSYATEPVPAVQPHTVTPPTGTMYSLETTAVAISAAVKPASGMLFELSLANPTATPAFVKLYNKATGPVPASDTPVLTIPLPANSAGVYQFGAVGKRFTTGIAIGITAAIGKTDTAATVAGLQVHATYI